MKLIGYLVGLFLLVLGFGCNASKNPNQFLLPQNGFGGTAATELAGSGGMLVSETPTDFAGTGGFDTSTMGGGIAASGGDTSGGGGELTPPIDSGAADGQNVGGGGGDIPIDIPPAGQGGGTEGQPGSITDPAIPAITGDCPNFVTGAFSYQGLTGQMVVGPMGTGDGALLFYWHGTAMPASMIQMGNSQSKITSLGGIIVSPDGPATGAGEAGSLPCSGTSVFGATITFDIIDQIYACAIRDYNINPRRVYSMGCSAGGLEAGCMALTRSSYVAAVAPNSGGILGATFQNAHAPAVMTMHGSQASDSVIVNFADRSVILDQQIRDAGGVAYDCNHGGGHCGAPANLLDAAVDFLLAHPFGVSPEPGLPPTAPAYCVAM